MTELMDKFEGYLSNFGFRDKGIWYFRISWMDPLLISFIKNKKGLAKKLGTINDIIRKGIKLPNNGKYDAGYAFIYQVTDKRINCTVN